MADRAHSADPLRSGRGQPVHSGANEIGLLAPTPLAFGIAGAIALPTAASAATSPSAAPSKGDDAGIAFSRGSAIAEAPAMPQPSGTLAVSPSSEAGYSATFATNPHAASAEMPGSGPFSTVPTMFGIASAHMVAAAPVTPINAPPSAAPEVSEVVDAVRASADALTGALQQLVARLESPAPATVEHVATTLDQIEQALGNVATLPLLDDVSAAATDLTAGAVETVGALTGTVDTALAVLTERSDLLLNDATNLATDAVEGVTQTLATTVDAALDGVGQLTGDVLAPATDALSGTVAAAVPAVSATTATLLDGAGKLSSTALETAATTAGVLAESVAETVAPTIGLAHPVADLVSDLAEMGGNDPAGGISTLTDMLANDEGFAILAPDAPDTATPVFASAGDVTEALETIADGVTTVLDPDEGGGLLDTAADAASTLLGGEKHGLGGLFDGDHGHG
jgi:hypothetical protein